MFLECYLILVLSFFSPITFLCSLNGTHASHYLGIISDCRSYYYFLFHVLFLLAFFRDTLNGKMGVKFKKYMKKNSRACAFVSLIGLRVERIYSVNIGSFSRSAKNIA